MASGTTTSVFCNLCSKSFTDPRLLPCLHVFCKPCLESLQSRNKGALTCPTCYKTSPHPPSNLPRHLRIEREVAISRIQERGKTVCGTCDKNNKAEAYCEDCSSGMCSNCVGMHKRAKAFKSHKVVSLHSAQPHSSTDLYIPIPCSIHPSETIKYYCISCSTLACSDCILDHKEHDCRHLDKTQEDEKAELQSVLDEVEKTIPSIVGAIERISDVIKCTCANGEKATEEVNEAFRRINAAVENRRLEILEEVKTSVAAKTTQLEIQKEGLEKITAGLQLALDSGRVACTEYSAIETLAIKAFIHQASKDLLEESHSTDFHPVNNSNLRVTINPSKVMEMFSKFGKVVTVSPYPPLCSLVGINPKLAIGVAEGCECVFTLQTRDSIGEDITERGAAEVRARITHPSSLVEVSECLVNDLDNGRYEIKFSELNEGQHQLHITIGDVSISGSPFTVNVMNFTTIKSPLITLETDDYTGYIIVGHNNKQYVSLDRSIVIYRNGVRDKKIPQSKLGGSRLRGIAVDEENEVVFVSSVKSDQIIKANFNGDVIASVGKTGLGQLEFDWPMGLCLTKGGILLVADNHNKRVQVLSSDLSFIRSIPCQSGVLGVAVDSTGNVHAAATDRVEVFSINGDKIMEYGKGVLSEASDVAFLSFQSRYSFITNVMDDDSGITDGEVYVFDWSNDTMVHSFAAGNPSGIKVDQEGAIFVCSWNNCEINKFVPTYKAKISHFNISDTYYKCTNFYASI